MARPLALVALLAVVVAPEAARADDVALSKLVGMTVALRTSAVTLTGEVLLVAEGVLHLRTTEGDVVRLDTAEVIEVLPATTTAPAVAVSPSAPTTAAASMASSGAEEEEAEVDEGEDEEGAEYEIPSVSAPSPTLWTRKWETMGPAIRVGFGFPYAGLGLEGLLYLQKKGLPVRGALHFAAGFCPGEIAGVLFFCGPGVGVFGAAGGASALLGNRHRAVLDLTLGLLGTVSNWTNPGTGVYGVTLGAGYEYVSDRGVTWSPTVGVSFPLAGTESASPSYNFGIGIGYKIL